jgi:hypothetical protein
MYMPDKYLGFDYEFKIPVKSARSGRLGAIGAKSECFCQEQNGFPRNPCGPAGFPGFMADAMPESADVMSVQ